MKTQQFIFPWRKAGENLNTLHVSMCGNNFVLLLNSSFGVVFPNLTIWNSSHPVQLENGHNSHLLYERIAKYSPRKLWLIHHQNHQKMQPKCLSLSLVNVWQPTLKKCHNIFKNPNPLNAWSLFPQAFSTYQNMFSLPIYIFSCIAFLN